MLEGDEWKYADGEHETPPTRAQRQARLDADYAEGLISHHRWQEQTAHSSGCASDGRVLILARPYAVR